MKNWFRKLIYGVNVGLQDQTCANCRHRWRDDLSVEGGDGYCFFAVRENEIGKTKGFVVKMVISDPGKDSRLYTSPDFGCNQFEPRFSARPRE